MATGFFHPGLGAIDDQAALKLGQYADHLPHRPARGLALDSRHDDPLAQENEGCDNMLTRERVA